MNVALPALIVFILLLPGFIVRSRFKRAERTSLDYSPFGQVATEAILWAGVFHAIWLGATKFFWQRELNASVFLKLVSPDALSNSKALDFVAGQFSLVSLYFSTMLIAAYIAPAAVRAGITRFRLDRSDAKMSFLFRFHKAPWYYLLTGADFKADEQPDLISISAIVEVSGQAVLYTGILDDFFFDSEGALDRLILQQVMRRPMDADKSSASDVDDLDRFYVVDGDYFVLRYSEAVTLNVEYIKLSNADGEASTTPDVAPGELQDVPTG